MNKKEKLLIEMVSALNHIGLNWYHILEDYLEYQEEKKLISIKNLAELRTIAIDIQSTLIAEY